MYFSRRRLFGLGIGLASFLKSGLGTAAQAAGDEEIPDFLVREILAEEAEPGSSQTLVIDKFWFEKPDGQRPNPRWAPDNVSFDYAHLTGQANTDTPFTITPEVIASLLELNSFQKTPARPRLLFGLRGCMPVPDPKQKNTVVSTRPDHLNARCVMGVWNIEANSIELFPASTVPAVDLMETFINGGARCNMLPTGLHHYKVGPHRGPRQPGAFIQQTPVWVHRTKKDLVYITDQPGTQWDDLDGDLPFDDLHAAMLSSRAKPPFFSSSGCQVVAGAYKDQVPTGPWADFRKAAGLTHPPKMLDSQHTADDGKEFDYVLLTGKDAQLASLGMEDGLKAARALRFGSSGPAVEELQAKLGATKEGAGLQKTGIIDRKTLGAIIAWQVANNLAQTGIIAQDNAGKLGLALPPLKLAKQ